MARKSLSPFIKKTEVNGVKIKLSAYQTRKEDSKTGQAQPLIVFYYEISGSDGSYRKLNNWQDALAVYNNLIEFEKRQLCL